MSRANTHHLYLYDDNGDFVRVISSNEMHKLQGQDAMYNSDNQRYNSFTPRSEPRTLSSRWSSNNRKNTGSYDSDYDSEGSTGTVMSVQTRSQSHRANKMKPKKLFTVDKLDSDWEPSDNEQEDPDYETESEDEYDELDELYEYDNWYYHNYINVY